ncbi:unnamed protein product [Acanthoscelides obtectus]|uniref:Thyroid transcription factor 1-associated protein 26 n=1 Tax=Acanthoscelides obtectus TaxID=200917 RepID=A0A9P0KSP3_ACAOB|nr:unnamed protein product [Acanthoscelides obtectus]CAK1671631.1 Thyroid transcription factor 1-associated protein 26 homolog [Acanthoscelides obtectus]
MAKHANSSKNFFKKPTKRGDTRTKKGQGSSFGSSNVQKTEANTTDDFFIKPGTESVKTSSNVSEQFSARKKDDKVTRNRYQTGQHQNHQKWREAKFDRGSENRFLGRPAIDERKQNNNKTSNFVKHGFREKTKFRSHTEHSEKNENDQVKKPFDKKKYRLQKYSKKYKLQQWEENRKKAIMHEYYKAVSKYDSKGLDVEKIYQEYASQEADEENDNNVNAGLAEDDKPSKSGGTDTASEKQIMQDPKTKKKPFGRVQDELKRMKEEKTAKREEFLKKKAEKDEARRKYKMEKVERFKKLSRKTKKGQPIMKDRIEMLLEKIQKDLQA